ncbi:hypothetical protein D3C72_1876220 [compost metagenome]
MVDEDAPADDRARMDLDARDDAGDIGNEAPHPLHAPRPAPVRPAMHDDGVQARITGQHLPAIAGGRVTFDDAVDVFAQVVEHNDNE